MSFKSRFVRIVLVVLLVVAFAGYFTFSTLFFNPLEGGLGVGAAALVPRDVDFFAARAKLSNAFSHFPRLVVQDRLDQNAGWKAWVASPEYANLNRDLKIEESLKKLSDAVVQIPLGMEPQQVFGGSELVVAGYIRTKDLAQADWAVYGRANWLGKLAASALFHPGLVGLEKRGLKVGVEKQYVSVEGADLPRKLFVTRIKDIVIIATKPEMVTAAFDLQAASFTDSLFQSAAYADHIHNAKNRTHERDELEMYLDVRKLADGLALPELCPDTKSQDFLPAFVGRLFQVRSMKNMIGLASADEGLTLDLHGEFVSERITAEQQKIYRARGFTQEDLLGTAASMAPADTSLFVYVHGGIGDLLRQARDAAEPALRQNLEDAFRNTGKYPTLDTLINELDGALKARFALIVRPNDYPEDPEGPPHDDTPVPAWAVVFWPKEVDVIKNLATTIGGQGIKFGLQGKKQGDAGFFENIDQGFKLNEFWSRFVPGTGMIATCNANDLTIVTNSFKMLSHILKTSTQGGEKYPRLSELPVFSALVRSSIQSGNVFAWANPRTIAPILRKSAARRAEESINIDWKSQRQRLEQKALAENFPGKKPPLSPEDQDAVDKIVDPQIASMAAKVKTEQVPAAMVKEERAITYAEQCSAGMLMLALNPKNFDLSVRLLVPLAEQK